MFFEILRITNVTRTFIAKEHETIQKDQPLGKQEKYKGRIPEMHFG